ncbi:DUF1840 domain-containing protein [Marinomonas gallaica]|uniref:DUF1840 domain-containing protein n=1 Tax=Marinomonas gallaica TaxID=1806667 RepID=UPI003CE44C67
MLMTFQCNASADITMFGSVGLKMVTMMGQPETKSGAIKAENIPHALEQLKAAVTHEKENDQSMKSNNNAEQEEPTVSLATRAVPLIEMLNAAIQEDCPIMWQCQ